MRTGQTRPQVKVSNVHRRQQAPATVDLRVVAVDLRHHEEDEAQGQRDGKPRHQRVGVDVQLTQAARGQGRDEVAGQGVELVEERLDRVGVVGARRKGAHGRESHGERTVEAATKAIEQTRTCILLLDVVELSMLSK